MRPRGTWPRGTRTSQIYGFHMGPKIFQLHGFPNVEHSFTSQLITRLLIGSYNKTKILGFEIHGIFLAKLTVSHKVLLYIEIELSQASFQTLA